VTSLVAARTRTHVDVPQHRVPSSSRPIFIASLLHRLLYPMTGVRKNRRAGGPQPWTTPEQLNYLRSQCGAYKECTSKEDFWAMLFEHWFTRWPASDLPPEGASVVAGKSRKPLTEIGLVKKVSQFVLTSFSRLLTYVSSESRSGSITTHESRPLEEKAAESYWISTGVKGRGSSQYKHTPNCSTRQS
jgi:hypothetical protein